MVQRTDSNGPLWKMLPRTPPTSPPFRPPRDGSVVGACFDDRVTFTTDRFSFRSLHNKQHSTRLRCSAAVPVFPFCPRGPRPSRPRSAGQQSDRLPFGDRGHVFPGRSIPKSGSPARRARRPDVRNGEMDPEAAVNSFTRAPARSNFIRTPLLLILKIPAAVHGGEECMCVSMCVCATDAVSG